MSGKGNIYRRRGRINELAKNRSNNRHSRGKRSKKKNENIIKGRKEKCQTVK